MSIYDIQPTSDVAARLALGAPADAESTSGSGSVVALLKRVRTLLGVLDKVGATPNPVATGTVDVQGAAAAAGLRLLGYSVRESAAAAAVATVILRHGTLATDPILAVVELVANASTTEWFGDRGLAAPNGVFVDRVAGETEGVVYTATT